MKKCIALTITTLACLTGFGQGTVNFANLAPAAGLNLPFYLNDGVTRLFGPQYRAGLFAGAAQANLSLIATVPFLSGGGAGYFNGGVVTITNVAGGGVAWVQVVAWDSTLGGTTNGATFFQAQSCGRPVWSASAVFSVVTGNPNGSPPTTPAILVGLTNRFVAYFDTFFAGITVQPTSQTAIQGDTVAFYVGAGAYPLPFYQWYFNGTTIPGATGTTHWSYRITSAQPTNAGNYSVMVSNQWGTDISDTVTLTVLPAQITSARMVPALALMGQSGSALNLDATDILLPAPNWTDLNSVMLTSASQWYFDLSEPLQSQRFYRAWQANAPVAPKLEAHLVPALTLTGSVGGNVRVDGRNQFGPTNAWFELATVTLTNTSQLYFDTSAIGQPPRLYRLVQVP